MFGLRLGDAEWGAGEVAHRHSMNGLGSGGSGEYVEVEAEVETTMERLICRR